MNEQQQLNYQRIAHAIDFINTHFKQQPDLDAIAQQVHLSPFHFQRMFQEWAGTTPKKFLQYISIEHAKKILNQPQGTLPEAAYETGLSGTSRLHDLFVKIEGMTPAEYKNGGKHLWINYSFAASRFGKLVLASTAKGICYLAFNTSDSAGFNDLKQAFPNASFQFSRDRFQQQALSIFENDWNNLPEVKLHLKATAFQLKVWEALLKIPVSQLSTYGRVAEAIGQPTAARAVGTAIGSNPVAFLIPCHRVIQASGQIGGYMWGSTRKTAIIGWESARYGADELE